MKISLMRGILNFSEICLHFLFFIPHKRKFYVHPAEGILKKTVPLIMLDK